MLQHEFEKLTGVKVSVEYFNAVNTDYMLSDLDKFAYCRLWKRTHVAYIKQLKREQEQREQELHNRFVQVTVLKDLANYLSFTTSFHGLTEKQLTALEYAKINPVQNISCLLFDIKFYLANI